MAQVIGVLGHKGRLGTELIKNWKCLPLDADIKSLTSLSRAIDEIKPDVIINCAAKSGVDKCEDEVIETYLVNAFGPRNISEVFSGKIVHLSTDYIFDGQKGNYSETDKANPLSVYGFSKFFGEEALKKHHDKLIVRTTILFDAGPKDNFPLAAWRTLKENKPFTAPNDLYGNPTYIPHLAHGIIVAIEKDLTGVLNIVGDGICSRMEFAQIICDIFGFDKTLVTNSPIWGNARRPAKAGLDTEKAMSLGIPIYDIMAGLLDWKKELEKGVRIES